MYCPKCGKEVAKGDVRCPNCGRSLRKQSAASMEREPASVSLVLGIIGIILIWFFALIGHILLIVGIVIGINENEYYDQYAGLVICIIGEVCAITLTIIGTVSI